MPADIITQRRIISASLYRDDVYASMDDAESSTQDLFDYGQSIGPAPLAIVFRLVGDPSTYARRIVPTLSVPPELYVAFTLNDMGLDVTALDTWTLTEDDVL